MVVISMEVLLWSGRVKFGGLWGLWGLWVLCGWLVKVIMFVFMAVKVEIGFGCKELEYV